MKKIHWRDADSKFELGFATRNFRGEK